MEYYKLLALQQAWLSCCTFYLYELNSDSIDKFVTRKPWKGDADVHWSSECDFNCNSDIAIAFSNLTKVAAIVHVLPVTTANVERSFSTMKLRSRLGEDTFEYTMRICIEGPDQLSDDVLESVVDHYKRVKKRKLAL